MIEIPIMLFDGASVSKTGAAAAAAILLMPNGRRYTVSQFLSKVTEDEAKYYGLIIGLQKAQRLGIRQLDVKGDSELVYYHINGSAPIKEPNLLKLYQDTVKLMRRFAKVTLDLIPPEQNRPAKTAVNRCIAEALGRETHPPTTSTPHEVAQITPNVARLIKLGTKATDGDYHSLTAEHDDFTLKSLDELREMIPDIIRDEIALHWDGDDNNLAEIYRWYLRGLSHEMAIRKVELDTHQKHQKIDWEKLPWEGELQPPDSQGNPQNPFLSPEEDKTLDISEQKTLIFNFNDFVEPESSPEPELIEESFALTSKPLVLEPLDFPLSAEWDTEEPPTEGDPNRDTVPSDGKIKHIMDLVKTLSLPEMTELSQELVKVPEFANLILKAIADHMAGGKG